MHDTATEKRPRDTLCIQLTNVRNLHCHVETEGLGGNHSALWSRWFCGDLCQRLWHYGALTQGAALRRAACLVCAQGRIQGSLVSCQIPVLNLPWLLNTLTCGFWCSRTPNTHHSSGTSMAGTMSRTKYRRRKKVPFLWSKGKPSKGITRVWVTVCLVHDSGDKAASCSGAGAKSHLRLLLLLVTTPAIQSPAETTLANASTWNVK